MRRTWSGMQGSDPRANQRVVALGGAAGSNSGGDPASTQPDEGPAALDAPASAAAVVCLAACARAAGMGTSNTMGGLRFLGSYLRLQLDALMKSVSPFVL